MNKPRHKLSKKQRRELFALFSLIAFSSFFVSNVLVSVEAYFVVRSGIFPIVDKDVPGVGKLIGFIALHSVLLNLIFIGISGKVWLKPVKRLLDGMNRLAGGDFSARMTIGKPFGDMAVNRAVSDSFNKMAEELENTEVLRSDFINNFSHEFKTPIVSIAGFAKLLKRGDLSEDERKEYVDIIEEESMRLSYMATNVLNLTKVENQTILTDVSVFNLSEQIRSCILLLEEKWSRKNLELDVDFDEYLIAGNEESLKHVWINLLDNAIKFSPDYGCLSVKIGQDDRSISVSVSNNGAPIPPELQGKIFNKFYQADESHSAAGNGIGLAIVKKITELHGGSVGVKSSERLTTFTVVLPKNQESER